MNERTISGRRAAAIVAAATVLLLVGLLVLVATGARQPSPASGTAPLAIDDLAPSTASLYRFAAEHGDHLAAVPCFCGCEEFLAHRNLEDCFVRSDRSWEPHASGCGVCVAEAITVRDTLAGGASIDDARRSIIQTFGTTPGTAPPAPGAAPTRQERS